MSYQDDYSDMCKITGNWLNFDDRQVDNHDPEKQAEWDMVCKITELTKEYHDRCDHYDRQICTGKNRYGEPMPVTAFQIQAVNNNARAVLKDIKTRVFGIPNSLLMEAIRNYKF